jgi:hypothetical protein
MTAAATLGARSGPGHGTIRPGPVFRRRRSGTGRVFPEQPGVPATVPHGTVAAAGQASSLRRSPQAIALTAVGMVVNCWAASPAMTDAA